MIHFPIRGGLFAAALALCSTALPLSPASAQTAGAELDRAAIQEIVREFLLENPEIMIEMQEVLEARQEERIKALQADTLTSREQDIYNSPFNAVFGDPEAPVTVVEFFDYNCGYCRRAMEDMERIVGENSDVRFVLKEWPVLGPQSVAAHRVSVAVNRMRPDLYAEFHRELLGRDGTKDGEAALEVAELLGMDSEALQAEAEKEYVEDAIRQSYDLADSLGIRGTPAYIVGDEVVGGARGYAYLMPRVANLRECGKSVC